MRWLSQEHVVAADVIVMPRSCSCSIQSIVAAPSCTSPICAGARPSAHMLGRALNALSRLLSAPQRHPQRLLGRSVRRGWPPCTTCRCRRECARCRSSCRHRCARRCRCCDTAPAAPRAALARRARARSARPQVGPAGGGGGRRGGPGATPCTDAPAAATTLTPLHGLLCTQKRCAGTSAPCAAAKTEKLPAMHAARRVAALRNCNANSYTRCLHASPAQDLAATCRQRAVPVTHEHA